MGETKPSRRVGRPDTAASRFAANPLSRRILLAAAASTLLLPPAVRAESAKMLRVGYVGMQPADAPIYDAFRERMAALGYRAGANFAFEYLRSPNVEAYLETYAALVALKPDIVLTAGSEPALRAAQAAAGGLPIVLLAVDFDPLARGYVPSLAHPGGNITGIFVPQLELARKRIELARELLPQATRLGILWDASSRDQAMASGEAARALGLEPRLIEVTDQPPDYAAAFARMNDARGEPVVVPASAVFLRDRAEIERVARERSIPMIAAFRENAMSGAVMSYGIDLADLFRDIADVVDHVAKGRKPADLPIAPPSHFHLALNLKTAGALGVTIPQTLLAIADEVME